MFDKWQSIIPNTPPVADIFSTHQLAWEFRQEVAYREDFAEYCRWYRLTAQQHQQELTKMRGDIPIFRWFLGRK